jgi:hypothetical protein
MGHFQRDQDEVRAHDPHPNHASLMRTPLAFTSLFCSQCFETSSSFNQDLSLWDTSSNTDM